MDNIDNILLNAKYNTPLKGASTLTELLANLRTETSKTLKMLEEIATNLPILDTQPNPEFNTTLEKLVGTVIPGIDPNHIIRSTWKITETTRHLVEATTHIAKVQPILINHIPGYQLRLAWPTNPRIYWTIIDTDAKYPVINVDVQVSHPEKTTNYHYDLARDLVDHLTGELALNEAKLLSELDQLTDGIHPDWLNDRSQIDN